MWTPDVVLATRTRWRIGGPAPAFAEARDEAELRGLLERAEGRSPLVLGAGANLLIADRGPGAPVLSLTGAFKSFELGDDVITFGAGAPIASVVQAARRGARAGLWILEAVPGTMGGALFMNAGTADEGIWSHVRWADVVWPDGRGTRVTREDVHPRYREIEIAPGAIFVRGAVDAPGADPERVESEHMRRREEKLNAQVYDRPTCGSTWKNPGPPAPSAWELVERVGMRGARRGDAQVSEKHANFIINLGEACARDIVELMVETRRRVFAEFGVHLEPEIRFWGFPDDVMSELGVRREG